MFYFHVFNFIAIYRTDYEIPDLGYTMHYSLTSYLDGFAIILGVTTIEVVEGVLIYILEWCWSQTKTQGIMVSEIVDQFLTCFAWKWGRQRDPHSSSCKIKQFTCK